MSQLVEPPFFEKTASYEKDVRAESGAIVVAFTVIAISGLLMGLLCGWMLWH
ncbi:MAG: hypothetical protein PHX43_02435 [Alphaproteobacteria bacterium]|nr:hypothetical protein [Alphaproteobacteria bacterium]